MRQWARWAGLGWCLLIPLQPLVGQVTLPSGWELLETEHRVSGPDTQFLGVSWRGVPLGTYNFGPALGERWVGTADTIIRRGPGVATEDGAAGSDLVVEALQWVSVSPWDAGAGLDYHFLTLQSVRPIPGAPSGGRLTTFGQMMDLGEGFVFVDVCDHRLTVAYDIRVGALDGPIVGSGTAEWFMIDWPFGGLPAGAWVLPGVNDGFALLGAPGHWGSFFWAHRYAVPEPGGVAAMVSLALAGWVGGRRARRTTAFGVGARN